MRNKLSKDTHVILTVLFICTLAIAFMISVHEKRVGAHVYNNTRALEARIDYLVKLHGGYEGAK